ncbi:MAG: hypothetical protein J3K34DRAFT_76823 [Monoraphidium minutum]|nr:MAG: hypothetical protein J3K34DRAFT_76823 [Monoraphidium minutum]
MLRHAVAVLCAEQQLPGLVRAAITASAPMLRRSCGAAAAAAPPHAIAGGGARSDGAAASTAGGAGWRWQPWRGYASPAESGSSGAASTSGGATGSVTLDESAVQRLLQLQAQAGPGKAVLLRIEVEGGGCSGFQYKFRLDSETGPDDRVFERGGARLVTDAVSLEFLQGAVVEYEDSLMRSAFQIASNPNSESTCGCGSSFVAKM